MPFLLRHSSVRVSCCRRYNAYLMSSHWSGDFRRRHKGTIQFYPACFYVTGMTICYLQTAQSKVQYNIDLLGQAVAWDTNPEMPPCREGREQSPHPALNPGLPNLHSARNTKDPGSMVWLSELILICSDGTQSICHSVAPAVRQKQPRGENVFAMCRHTPS